jgi:hypothetical protein
VTAYFITTGLGLERFHPFFDNKRNHNKRRDGVGPPPTQKRVEQKPAEQYCVKVNAEICLPGVRKHGAAVYASRHAPLVPRDGEVFKPPTALRQICPLLQPRPRRISRRSSGRFSDSSLDKLFHKPSVKTLFLKYLVMDADGENQSLPNPELEPVISNELFAFSLYSLIPLVSQIKTN